MQITWLPLKDNYIEGSLSDAKFFIHLKDSKVESLYIIAKNKDKRKVLATEHNVTTIEEMKIVAYNLYYNKNMSK
jgi:hypothetical protein